MKDVRFDLIVKMQETNAFHLNFFILVVESKMYINKNK